MYQRQTESAVEAALVKGVRALGGRADKLLSAVRGIPDRLVLLPGGRVYLVELKDENGAVSPLQELYHTHCAELGTDVIVLRGVAQVRAWLARQAPTHGGRAAAWTEDDDDYVLDTIDSDLTAAEVAGHLGRSVTEISARRSQLLSQTEEVRDEQARAGA